jgi:hypothetical protein
VPRPSPAPEPDPQLSTVDFNGVGYTVRAVTGAATLKAYRCPGCDQEIRLGTPHVVVWPYGETDAGSRRHWHTVCWDARDRRGSKILRARSAPKYG